MRISRNSRRIDLPEEQAHVLLINKAKNKIVKEGLWVFLGGSRSDH
jgi:hypothetical protein